MNTISNRKSTLDKDFFNNLTIMYVEDEKNIRDKLVLILETLFKNTIICTNGKEGYEAFKASKENGENIDIVVSDINMDEMNGMDMLKLIRQIDDKVPFIFTTAYSDSEYINEAKKYGVSYYVIKPIDVKEILIYIKEIFDK
ncbi:MAG: response regulator [Campylobacterota bacterium]|nr:response regulator [Campylobacterota bacterium]